MQQVGKYPLEKELGRGAMGVVYLGTDPVIERRVAIKTTQIPDPGDPEIEAQLERFRREAQAAGRLNHPNIVTVYDYGETTDVCYLVMEYVPGHSLADAMLRGELFTVGEALALVQNILQALAHAHGQGVVHRDIKPGNILLSDQGSIKITDFGIARIESSTLTQSGALLGTPGYMSPEQFTSDPVDGRTDLYSTGVLLYELLTCDKAFAGSLSEVLQKVLNEELPPASEHNPQVPPTLDNLIQKATAKDKEQRFADAAAFSASLADIQKELPDSQARPVKRVITADMAPTLHDADTVLYNGATVKLEPIPEPAQAASRSGRVLLWLGLSAVLGYAAYHWWPELRTLLPGPQPRVEQTAAVPEPAQTPPPASTQEPTEEQPPVVETPATPAPNLPVQPEPVTEDETPPLLALTSNKGKLPQFSPGEQLVVELVTGQDALTYCYYEQYDGRVFRIFPNRFRNNPLLEAGQKLSIPDETMKFNFTFERSGAVELVHCFASAEPFESPLPENLLAIDLIPMDVQGIAPIKAAFQQAAGAALVETALLIQVK